MHFGTYDYTASTGITAKYQEMDHPVCDFAHHMTKVALAHTGTWLSDGATNTMPIGPHRGDQMTEEELEENKRVVHRAWKKGYDHIRHSLWNGFYQGWDLNPAQLPMRYAATYVFFLESYEDAALRLNNFVAKTAQATLTGDVFDDAATGQGLLNYFLKAINCGAISEGDLVVTGLTLEDAKVIIFGSNLNLGNITLVGDTTGGESVILKQKPPANGNIKVGDVVDLWIGKPGTLVPDNDDEIEEVDNN